VHEKKGGGAKNFVQYKYPEEGGSSSQHALQSLIFTIMIFHNVSWKSCGYLFRYFVFIIVFNMSQINDFCFIWCFNNVQLYANRNLY
jgi:hypothetical protein